MTRRSLITAHLACLVAVLAVAPERARASDAPAPTEIAAIEATAPLDDSSEEAVKAAIVIAVQKAARGALAMGLPWVHVQGAYVRPGYVGVQVVAMARRPTDSQPGLGDRHAPAPDQRDVPDNAVPEPDGSDTSADTPRIRI